jgi:large subunit ribosomal protein L10
MRAEKKQLVQDIGQLLQSSAHLFLVTYKGITVEQFSDLRTKLAAQGAECHVVPNRLFKRAAEEAGLESLTAVPLAGDTAVVTGGEDAVAVAKTLRDLVKGIDAVTLKAGALDGKRLEPNEIVDLAALPGREILLAQLLGVLQAPARNLVSVLSQKTASIVYVLQAYADKQQQQ